MNITIRKYKEIDLPFMLDLWNNVVEEGISFPQMEPMSFEESKTFFAYPLATRVTWFILNVPERIIHAPLVLVQIVSSYLF